MHQPGTSEHLLPAHHGPWTIDDVLALPEDHSQRIEVVDGALIVRPLGTYRHQRLLLVAAVALRDACPAELEATIEVYVRLSSERLLVPDFTIIRPGSSGDYLPAEDLLPAGEVLSPTTRINDLLVKRQLYAEAAVPLYLVVDPKEPVVAATLLELQGTEYVEIATSRDGVLTIERPFPATIALSV
ncbi:hypothetical protein Lesp02_18670 [Lentzea sp. NBRC 105346]|uniref:Uma2 family endonuclease n=1 Tax=Lentzea sp. NBRC 105346 TaxID=3032205 RepID=UPI0024A4CA63|nr:Uma2 family endonuclease [Lentzea sp. NBRC 105346]GLZ29677.1 hypothetical protein Lesp02_18670 [Lentzea sp. NBRC 105346]